MYRVWTDIQMLEAWIYSAFAFASFKSSNSSICFWMLCTSSIVYAFSNCCASSLILAWILASSGDIYLWLAAIPAFPIFVSLLRFSSISCCLFIISCIALCCLAFWLMLSPNSFLDSCLSFCETFWKSSTLSEGILWMTYSL